MKCNNCGMMDFNASSCPDCGSENVVEETGGAQVVAPALPSSPPAILPTMPDPADASAAMPDIGMSMMATPVVGTIKLPEGAMVELRAGQQFTVAHETSEADPIYRISGDDSVSGTPIMVDADTRSVTGGGSSGFALDFTIRFKPETVVELPKSLAELIILLQSGAGNFTATGLKVGKANRFALKF